MAFVNFLSNFTNGLFRHFVCFEKFHSPVSELIHLARCVKFSPYFIPEIVLIVFCGTQSNRRTNFIPRLAGFNPRLALIVFSGTGTWSILTIVTKIFIVFLLCQFYVQASFFFCFFLFYRWLPKQEKLGLVSVPRCFQSPCWTFQPCRASCPYPPIVCITF